MLKLFNKLFKIPPLPQYSEEGIALFDLLKKKDEWNCSAIKVPSYVYCYLEHKDGLRVQTINTGAQYYVQVSSDGISWSAIIFTTDDHKRLYPEVNKLYVNLFNKPLSNLIFDSLNKSCS